MAGSSKKATFTISRDVLEALNGAVTAGAAPSKNAFVERALVKELKELRRLARRAQWEEAMRDPQFLKDLSEVETAFAPADAETAKGIG
ncbi:MAG: hypothetical protein HY675_12160 [Chloroflexi bacterium]|nr:hypothetical protein [Chloroflexota bacterium]